MWSIEFTYLRFHKSVRYKKTCISNATLDYLKQRNLGLYVGDVVK